MYGAVPPFLLLPHCLLFNETQKKYFSLLNNIKNNDDVDVTDNDNSFYVWG
jgi:hypothetical protein